MRAGLSVAVPLLTVVALDRTSWAVYAVFGAFTALYGRNHVHLPRAVMQATAGVALVASVVVDPSSPRPAAARGCSSV